MPGITECIKSALGDPFVDVPPAVMKRAQQLGKAAHYARHLDDMGALDEATVDPVVLPRLEAWRAFRRETGIEILFSEIPLYHDAYGYAGTPDLLAGLRSGEHAVVEMKNGLPDWRAGLQTAAQADLFECLTGEKVRRRFVMRTLPNSRYKFDECTEPQDMPKFLACLSVHRMKEQIANE